MTACLYMTMAISVSDGGCCSTYIRSSDAACTYLDLAEKQRINELIIIVITVERS